MTKHTHNHLKRVLSRKSVVATALSLGLMSFTQPVFANWQHCSTDGFICAFGGTKLVRYGANNQWATQYHTDATICNSSVFGDPAVGVHKTCSYNTNPLIQMSVFDLDYYLATNQDLKTAFATNPTAAIDHWLNNGIAEGRQASPTFDPRFYLNKYADLKAAFGNNYTEALNHWLNNGIAEGRQGSPLFHSTYYLSNYSDVSAVYGTDNQKAIEHWLTTGIREKRQGSPIFDLHYYFAKYPDMRQNFSADPMRAIEHWIVNGIDEGRQGSLEFDPIFYLAQRPDLQTTYGTDYLALAEYWLISGINDGTQAAAHLNILSNIKGEHTTETNGVTFAWSHQHTIEGMTCIAINEGAEPAAYDWHNNYFCSSSDIGMAWSSASELPGMKCTAITEALDPYTWTDNYLCLPVDSEYTFEWSSAGSKGLNPVLWNEPKDPHTWADNYLNISSFGNTSSTNKPLNELSWVTAHNAYAVGGGGAFANQEKTMLNQMRDFAVRGLMLDIQFEDGKIELAHSDYNFGGFIDEMDASLEQFLIEDPDAIISIDFEIDSSEPVTYAQLAAAIDQLPKLKSQLFNPWSSAWSNHDKWPTPAELKVENQRVILMVDKPGLAKTSATDQRYSFLYRPTFTVENMWSETGYSQCSERVHFGDPYIFLPGSNANGWPRLFTMNHFGSSGSDPLNSGNENNWDGLFPRITDTCIPAAKVGNKPNMVAVDYVNLGDVQEITEVMDNGGIILYEGNNATQNIVCGIAAHEHRSFGAGNYGCENDEARSGKLVGVKAGTSFAFYDSPNGNMEDDYVSIYVKQNIGTIGYIINSFEQDLEDEYVKVVFTRNNGLDGKISKFEVAPVGFSGELAPFKPTVTFYEGGDGTQNIVCTLTLEDNTVNFKNDPYGCDNDEARSAVFKNVRANTQLILWDDPNGSFSDDYSWIIFKTAQSSYTINSFEQNLDNSAVRQFFGGHNGLNGKVSRAAITRMWDECASEGQSCTFNGIRQVTYGADSRWVTKTFTDQVTCGVAEFGVDPAYGTRKKCYVEPDWSLCALYGETCQVSGSKNVYYGTGKSWTWDTFSSSLNCNFGIDPAFGYLKACFTE